MPFFTVRGPVALPAAGPAAKSLVLAAASSQYLTRTWGASPTDNKKATIAFFIKRTSVQSDFAQIYDGGAWNGGSSESSTRFNGSDEVSQVIWDGSSVTLDYDYGGSSITDTTTWHHVVSAMDTSQGAADDVCKMYLDGVLLTGGGRTAPALNSSLSLTVNGIVSAIGRCQGAAGRYLNAKLAYFYFIDGQQLDPSNFTTGTGAGTTHPAAYGGSFGTNGFYLNFTGDSLNDQSGNTNHWTPQNSPTFSTDIPT